MFKKIGQEHYLKSLYNKVAIIYEKMGDLKKAEKYKNKRKGEKIDRLGEDGVPPGVAM